MTRGILSFKLQTLCLVGQLFKDYRVSSSVQTNKNSAYKE